MGELRPAECPFCGGGVFWVSCWITDCGDGPRRDTEEEAIRAWNCRPTNRAARTPTPGSGAGELSLLCRQCAAEFRYAGNVKCPACGSTDCRPVAAR